MLRPGPAAGFPRGLHLHIRVHLLFGMRVEEARVRLPQLWRRTRPASGSPAGKAREESGLYSPRPSAGALWPGAGTEQNITTDYTDYTDEAEQ